MMYKIVKSLWLALLTSVFLITSLSADDGRYYVHIKYADGNVLIQRAIESGVQDALRGMPVMAGDRLWTENGRIELQFSDGSILSLDRDTKVDFEAIGEPIEGDDQNTVLKLWSGSIYIRMYYDLDRGENLQIETMAGYVSILNRGKYRIDVEDDYSTRVTVREGLAEAGNRNGSEMIRTGQRLFIESGEDPAEAFDFADYEYDEFSSWVEERDMASERRRIGRKQYVDDSLDYLVDDMDDYGEWEYYDEFNSYIWIPRTRYIFAGWRPYYNGYWAWTPHGYSFVSYDPWSWVTYRYGRWDWCGRWGWCWIPGYRYSPAWVHWEIGGNYIGWAPLGYYNYPVNRYFYKKYPRGFKSRYATAGGSKIAMDPANWTVVKKKNFAKTHLKKVALSKSEMQKLNRKGAKLHTVKVNKKGFLDRKTNYKAYSNSYKGSIFKSKTTSSSGIKKSTAKYLHKKKSSSGSSYKSIYRKGSNSKGTRYKSYGQGSSSSGSKSGSVYKYKSSKSSSSGKSYKKSKSSSSSAKSSYKKSSSGSSSKSTSPKKKSSGSSSSSKAKKKYGNSNSSYYYNLRSGSKNASDSRRVYRSTKRYTRPDYSGKTTSKKGTAYSSKKSSQTYRYKTFYQKPKYSRNNTPKPRYGQGGSSVNHRKSAPSLKYKSHKYSGYRKTYSKPKSSYSVGAKRSYSSGSSRSYRSSGKSSSSVKSGGSSHRSSSSSGSSRSSSSPVKRK